jgi:hypothetical protein
VKILVTAKAAKKLQFKDLPRLDSYEADIYCWRLDYLQKYELFMVTNEKSYFTHLISAFVTFDDLISFLEPAARDEIKIYKSNNRRVIGTMTEMKHVIKYSLEAKPESSAKSVQHDLNRMIYSATGYDMPCELHKTLQPKN